MPFTKGDPNINREGRPKGKSLKEFAREMLMSMSDEEKIEYMSKLPKEIVWKMAEGNPRQDTDMTSGGESIAFQLISYDQSNNDSLSIPTTPLSAESTESQTEI